MSINVDVKNLYQPSYIIDKSPLFYGGKQEEYIALAENAIASGIELLADEIKNEIEPQAIYYKLVKFLQNARHEIALVHQPEKAHLFGIPRNDPNLHQEKYITPVTGLYSNYEEYNNKFIDRLINILSQIPHDLKTFSKKSIFIKEEVLGKKCSFHAELLDSKDLQQKKYINFPSIEELHQALGIDDKTPEEIVHDYSLMNQLKLEHKDIYDRILMAGILSHINLLFPSPAMKDKIDSDEFLRFERKNIYVLATLRLELEPDKMFCVARHITWMYQDYVQDPLERMRDHSVDFVIHQDPFLIERTQNVCSEIFADILTWNESNSIDVLKDRVALLRFVYGNSMPCSRGDGAIGDWLELIIYRYLGFEKTRHNNQLLPCFELLSVTKLSQYLEDYRKTIVVE